MASISEPFLSAQQFLIGYPLDALNARFKLDLGDYSAGDLVADYWKMEKAVQGKLKNRILVADNQNM